MNLSKPLRAISKLLYALRKHGRLILPRQTCHAFGRLVQSSGGIGPVFVINLDRQPRRWLELSRELTRVTDAAGAPLVERTIRFTACDAQAVSHAGLGNGDVNPFYTLADQLFVEPQPLALPDEFDLTRPIAMSAAEVAVAQSHIEIWKQIAQSDALYSLILEDDVWFDRGFGPLVDAAWHELKAADGCDPMFDVLYLSFKEVRHGAPKEFVSPHVFKPERGLWYMSGYVLSKQGAQALLKLLPCSGPVDLWINLQFKRLKVRSVRRSVINQRLDLQSTNSYSILPMLSRIGVLDGGEALFQQRPAHVPVFVFGAPGSGLSSMAMALSMLGYRCCSDLDQLPEAELQALHAGRSDRVFDAYVNIGDLRPHWQALYRRFPTAKFVLIEDHNAPKEDDLAAMDLDPQADVLRLAGTNASGWRSLCEHLRLAPPSAPYPVVPELGQRVRQAPLDSQTALRAKKLRHDLSPWIIESRVGWTGIPANGALGASASRIVFEDDFSSIDPARWLARNDTFPGNLGLFRPANVQLRLGGGLELVVGEASLGVRDYSAAALSSRGMFLFGRFEATLQSTNTPGLVTGFFLHRDSPRQEIDVEIAGNRPDQLLVNVFYNPGADGAKYDYGYRGTPTAIALGFDASQAMHRYAIEWDACEIRWFVDDELVHRRVTWDPTPIPNLPMTLHVNSWPTRSRELAGRLAPRALPASALLRTIAVNAFRAEAKPVAATLTEA